MSAVIETKTIYVCSNERELKFREELFNSKRSADCEFLVGPNEEKCSGHRLYLEGASQRMQDLLTGDSPVKIPNIDPVVFKEMLRAIYTNLLTISDIDFAFKLAKAAKEFGLVSVRAHCINYMSTSKNINVNTVVSVLEVGDPEATDFDEGSVKDECWKLIRSQTPHVLRSDGFLNAKPETVLAIFSQYQLYLSSEIELVDALFNYAVKNNALPNLANAEPANQSRFEQYVLPALEKIRFLSIPLHEIYRSESITALIQPSVITGITAIIIAPESNVHKNLYPANFSTRDDGRLAHNFSAVGSSSSSIAYTAEITNKRNETEMWDASNSKAPAVNNGTMVPLTNGSANGVNGSNGTTLSKDGSPSVEPTTSTNAQSTPNGICNGKLCNNYAKNVNDQNGAKGPAKNLRARKLMADEDCWEEN